MGHSHPSSKSNVVRRTHLIAPVGSSNSSSKGWKSIQSHNYSFERDENDKCNIISSQQEENARRDRKMQTIKFGCIVPNLSIQLISLK